MNTKTFDTIRQWTHDTFGIATPTRTVFRACEEFDELMEAAGLNNLDEMMNEAADVVITLCNPPGLGEAIDRKMAKNRARTWKVMGDGTGYHVNEDAAA